uniref:Glutamine amidotransferase domain-containing protein n=1 Tax=Chromera velia CCMP2878 TaxID=1169474 RepID=A0A0G4GQK7_9ALVE|eukprot:Cvel_706.t1-p1 / transcript=Cvel_706.t1 / gene=Cvel_706 / organism=Chromera_velia_CCMP2878 / gene_product=Putative glutamine amidotransferase-like protein, putative / transcript_product=Putative glutamine amidotransferase-like protein, putative / location=Cvel_scaffold22:37504-41539(-) / protein_length=756 / sequence_SO=supercontig / SO=protein_coding / is_pseudo=false
MPFKRPSFLRVGKWKDQPKPTHCAVDVNGPKDNGRKTRVSFQIDQEEGRIRARIEGATDLSASFSVVSIVNSLDFNLIKTENPTASSGKTVNVFHFRCRNGGTIPSSKIEQLKKLLRALESERQLQTSVEVDTPPATPSSSSKQSILQMIGQRVKETKLRKRAMERAAANLPTRSESEPHLCRRALSLENKIFHDGALFSTSLQECELKINETLVAHTLEEVDRQLFAVPEGNGEGHHPFRRQEEGEKNRDAKRLSDPSASSTVSPSAQVDRDRETGTRGADKTGAHLSSQAVSLGDVTRTRAYSQGDTLLPLKDTPSSQLSAYSGACLQSPSPGPVFRGPRILIVSRHHMRKNKPVDFVSEAHLDLIQRFGGAPVIVPRTALTLGSLDTYLPMDGFLVVEGEDLSDSYCPYGREGNGAEEAMLQKVREKHASDTTHDTSKDQLEWTLLQLCLKHQIPYLGICRGSQMLNVACGGTLYFDVVSQVPNAIPHIDYENYDTYRHPVEIVRETPLAEWYTEECGGGKVKGKMVEEGGSGGPGSCRGAGGGEGGHGEGGKVVMEMAEPGKGDCGKAEAHREYEIVGEISVNSYHHQGVRKLAPALRPMAFSPDGLVEGFYMPSPLPHSEKTPPTLMAQMETVMYDTGDAAPQAVEALLEGAGKESDSTSSSVASVSRASSLREGEFVSEAATGTAGGESRRATASTAVDTHGGAERGVPEHHFIVGLQFHPERMLGAYPGNLRVYEAFLSAARACRNRRD